MALVQSGAASAVVTNPISKATLASAGFGFPGHTEFLAALAGREASDAVMMLVGEGLKVVPVTIHIPLKDVIGALSTERILKTLEITARDVARYFGLARPRIAVTGLNPHAGEDGIMGREEIETIVPAIAAAQRQGLDVTGPYPADTLFHAEARKSYDVAVAMYHDQALIPVKTLAFDTGVNVTLGLPFVRTSPDHGTAFRSRRHRQSKPTQPDRGLAPCRHDAAERGRSALSTPDGLPPLRDIIRDLGLTARKSLGQNFLLDFNLTRRIARAAGPLEGATIVEVGPGPGGLTRALLMEGASRVIAIEKDERCLPALADIAAAYPGRLEIVAGDARDGRLWRPRCAGPCAHRRQSSLQRRHAAPDRLAKDRALAALVRPAGAHVSARSGAPHRGQARQQGFRPPRRAQPMAHRSSHPADASRRSLHAAAKGRLLAR